jgi:hypothetical protein
MIGSQINIRIFNQNSMNNFFYFLNAQRVTVLLVFFTYREQKKQNEDLRKAQFETSFKASIDQLFSLVNSINVVFLENSKFEKKQGRVFFKELVAQLGRIELIEGQNKDSGDLGNLQDFEKGFKNAYHIHGDILDNYFIYLTSIIDSIEQNHLLTEEEKKVYLKRLQLQLSYFEIVLLGYYVVFSPEIYGTKDTDRRYKEIYQLYFADRIKNNKLKNSILGKNGINSIHYLSDMVK